MVSTKEEEKQQWEEEERQWEEKNKRQTVKIEELKAAIALDLLKGELTVINSVTVQHKTTTKSGVRSSGKQAAALAQQHKKDQQILKMRQNRSHNINNQTSAVAAAPESNSKYDYPTSAVAAASESNCYSNKQASAVAAASESNNVNTGSSSDTGSKQMKAVATSHKADSSSRRATNQAVATSHRADSSSRRATNQLQTKAVAASHNPRSSSCSSSDSTGLKQHSHDEEAATKQTSDSVQESGGDLEERSVHECCIDREKDPDNNMYREQHNTMVSQIQQHSNMHTACLGEILFIDSKLANDSPTHCQEKTLIISERDNDTIMSEGEKQTRWDSDSGPNYQRSGSEEAKRECRTFKKMPNRIKARNV
jgi:hypothetical protein